jgi:hypothetical protein
MGAFLMIPRLMTSKKWTEFPKEYISQITEVFKEGFKAELEGVDFFVEGRIYPEEIMLRIGILEPGRIAQANFEVSALYDAKKQDAIEWIYTCIDAAGTMMGEYFEADGEVEFPRTWKEIDFDGKKIFTQFTTVNSRLEAEADAILGNAEKALVVEKETEDALDLAVEKIAPEDDEDDFEDDEDYEDDTDEVASAAAPQKPKRKEDLH